VTLNAQCDDLIDLIVDAVLREIEHEQLHRDHVHGPDQDWSNSDIGGHSGRDIAGRAETLVRHEITVFAT